MEVQMLSSKKRRRGNQVVVWLFATTLIAEVVVAFALVMLR
jgi:hypothetical protein